MQIYIKYLEFLKYSVSEDACVPEGTETIDWHDYCDFCYRQGISGIVYDGIDRCRPNILEDDLLDWFSDLELVRSKNKQLNEQSIKITKYFQKKGFRSCILKGQANAMMYPKPELRTSGDIDIWLDGNTKDIINLILFDHPEAKYGIHHIQFLIEEDVSVEVHYQPIYLPNMIYQRRLKGYLDSVREEQFQTQISLDGSNDKVGRLSDSFNAVFMMLHMYKHCFSSRNNFKQLVDYYYLLKRGFSETEKKKIVKQFKNLGVNRYAAGVMWILQEILGLEKKYILGCVDTRFGKVLLNDVLTYGEERNPSKVPYLVKRVKDNLHLLQFFPMAVMIDPIYLIWHQWWKLKMNLSLKM